MITSRLTKCNDEAFAAQMTEQDQQQVRRFIADANAEAMLTWALGFQQRAGL